MSSVKKRKSKKSSQAYLPKDPTIFKEPGPPALQSGEMPLLNFDAIFTEEEIAQLTKFVDATAKKAGAGVEAAQLAQIRRSQVSWLDYDEHAWVYKKVWKMALDANKKFRFNIDSIADRIQIAVYDQSEQGFYRWHSDNSPHLMIRKISISIPLNDPSEYDGGELQFNLNGDPIQINQKKGTAIAFPSFILHRVTPVTRGRRYSMVTWIYGPHGA